MSYLLLILTLGTLGFVYIYLPANRLWASVVIGLAYFLWGIWRHWEDKTLHWSIVLEYFCLAILGMSLLIFLSLRA